MVTEVRNSPKQTMNKITNTPRFS
uniref:Uncharacterized protein n=1 Tax=Anguilla anguilla TaxID=7936 RepID=A0A0E9RQF4_ANGAN